jgi:protein O-GlcNAc transferase
MGLIMKKNTLPPLLQQALSAQTQGDLAKARTLFESVLQNEPHNVVALYSLGAIESGESQHAKALPLMQRAVAAAPQFAQAHLALSVIYFNLGQLDQAASAVQQALVLEPHNDNIINHRNTVQLAQQGASNSQMAPEVVSLNSQAIALQAQGQHAQAEALLQQSLALEPNNFLTLYSLGVSRSSQMDFASALHYFDLACQAAPKQALAHFAKGKTLHDLGLAEDALQAYDQAIAADPKYMEAYTNKAALLQGINRHHDALLTLTAATEINPNHVRALEGQGQLLGQYKQYTLATNAFRRALQVDPTYDYGQGHLMGARQSNCDWTDFEANRQSIFKGIEAGKLVCGPLTIMGLTDDVAIIGKCAELYATDKYKPSSTPLWTGETYKHRKKRVAFISADFRIHPVGYLLIGLIEKFDKSKFELTGFFTGVSDKSDLWQRYRCAFDHYIDCAGMTSIEVAKLMRAMEIDVAIDLSGHTEGTRLDILAHRPAPAQVTYLGFPGTLGLPYIDYLIADPRLIPEDLAPHYKEKVLRLPHCYLPRDESVVPSPVTPKRSDFGLPETGTIFCSFNHDYKINPPLFKVWMDLLKAVPGSVLWLMKLNEGAHANLRESAKQQGVDPERIIFATRVPRVEDHLARYRLVDVFIDTYPYNGHTTASDALLAGLPVVTLQGKSFASRVAASLLHDVGLPDLACSSYDEYYQKALHLATNDTTRLAVKELLMRKLEAKEWPFTSEQQARTLEALLINL